MVLIKTNRPTSTAAGEDRANRTSATRRPGDGMNQTAVQRAEERQSFLSDVSTLTQWKQPQCCMDQFEIDWFQTLCFHRITIELSAILIKNSTKTFIFLNNVCQLFQWNCIQTAECTFGALNVTLPMNFCILFFQGFCNTKKCPITSIVDFFMYNKSNHAHSSTVLLWGNLW